MTILNINQLNLRHKRVLIREDLNVPLEHGQITSDARIKAAVPTIQQALEAGAAVMIMSHLGRPEEGHDDEAFSLYPVSQRLSEYLGVPVRFAKEWIDGISVAPGEVVLCENTRFLVGENANDPVLAKKMAALCDVFVMDAFATAHRAQASTYGVAVYAPIACAGLLFCQEVHALEQAMLHPKHPVLAIVGGSKVSSKLTILDALSTRVDKLIVGGGIANTFIAAAGFPVGKSLYEPDLIPEAKRMIAQGLERGCEIPIPVDVVVADRVAKGANISIKALAQISEQDVIVDIGPETIKQYEQIILSSNTVVWNGPVGVFEIDAFSFGTEAIAKTIAYHQAFSLAGGGDTVAAIEKFGVFDKISYISTAGGAFLEFLEGKVLPGIEILEKRAREELKTA